METNLLEGLEDKFDVIIFNPVSSNSRSDLVDSHTLLPKTMNCSQLKLRKESKQAMQAERMVYKSCFSSWFKLSNTWVTAEQSMYYW